MTAGAGQAVDITRRWRSRCKSGPRTKIQHDTMEITASKLYYLEMDSAKTSWNAWQKGLYNAAKKFDRQLFTVSQIIALGTWLSGMLVAYRNHGDVTMPDWDFCNKYGYCPQIGIGNGCSLIFKPVAGYYNGQ